MYSYTVRHRLPSACISPFPARVTGNPMNLFSILNENMAVFPHHPFALVCLLVALQRAICAGLKCQTHHALILFGCGISAAGWVGGRVGVPYGWWVTPSPHPSRISGSQFFFWAKLSSVMFDAKGIFPCKVLFGLETKARVEAWV